MFTDYIATLFSVRNVCYYWLGQAKNDAVNDGQFYIVDVLLK